MIALTRPAPDRHRVPAAPSDRPQRRTPRVARAAGCDAPRPESPRNGQTHRGHQSAQ